MDENLKYYKVTGPGIEQDVVLGIMPEQVDETMRRYGERGYMLEETEKPEGAHIVNARPPEPMDPFALEYLNYAMYEPYINVKHSVYDTNTCERCKNRYKRSEFCDRHCTDKNCYRFKLER